MHVYSLQTNYRYESSVPSLHHIRLPTPHIWSPEKALMSSSSAKGALPADCSKNHEVDCMGAGFDRSSIPAPDGQCTRMGTAEEALAILQYYVMVFILGIEGHLPECHWTHNVLVYLPVVWV